MSTTATDALNAGRTARLSADRTLNQRLLNTCREPHPIARKTATLKPHQVPWLSVYAKRTLSTFGVLVPLAVVVFGWPFAAKWMVNLSNQVYASSSPRRNAAVHEPRESHKIARRAMLQRGPMKMEA